MDRNGLKCNVCTKQIQRHAKRIKCSLCHNLYHANCITLSRDEQQHLIEDVVNWYCRYCNETIFPFNHLEDETEYVHAILASNDTVTQCYMSDKILQPFEINDLDENAFESDIDPDLNFYNGISFHLQNNCKYYSEDTFQAEAANPEFPYISTTFSICHFNIRSVRQKFI